MSPLPFNLQKKSPRLGTLVVVTLALAIRLVHVAASTNVPTAQHLIGDAAGYYDWSQRIAGGEWVGTKGFYQAPLYPYVMAVWYLFAPDSATSLRILQALWGSLACGLLCVATTNWFGRRAGFLAGLMLALYGPAIYFDGILQKASLDNLLVCAAIACIAWLIVQLSPLRCALLGTVVSLLCLTRENAMAWHLVIPIWIGWCVRTECRVSNGEVRMDSPRSPLIRGGGMIAAYLLGAAVVLAPVGARNWYVQREFALTTFQAGPNFYIGNNRNADGRYQPLIRGHETPEFEQRDATDLAEKATGRAMSPREVSRYWMGRAWADIASEPIQWMKLAGYKILLVWNRYEIADAESITVYRRHSPLLDVLCKLWGFDVLAALAILGIALTWNKRRQLWIMYALLLTMTLAVAAFYVLGRYRYPLVPLLVPFAAAGCRELWRNRSQLGSIKGPLGLAIVGAIIVNLPIQDERKLNAMAEMNAGVALAKAGEIEEAGEYFALAVAGHPTSAEANYNLAMSLAMQGKFAEAIPPYQRALASDPNLSGAHFNLAVAMEQSGQTKEAERNYEIAVRNDPGDVEAKAALDRLKMKR